MNIQNTKLLIKHIYGKHLKGQMRIRGKQIPVMLVGATGVGKTQVIDQVGDEIKVEFDLPDFEVINLRLSQKEQGDLVGMPFEIEMVPCPYCIENGQDHFHQDVLHVKHKLLQHIEKTHIHELKTMPTYKDLMDVIRTKYSHLIEIRTANATPDFLPTKGHGIIHLDEYNRASLDVRNAAFEFVEKGQLGTYKLPKGWIILSSINPPSEDYIVHDIDLASVARFVWILFCPEAEEWIKYAKSINLNPNVIRFIQAYGKFLGNELVDYPYEPRACPRTHEMMGHLLEGLPDKLVYEVASGCIGAEAATAYMSILKDSKRPISALKILNEYPKVEKTIKEYSKTSNNRADLVKASIDDILADFAKRDAQLTEEQITNLYSFCMDIPKDMTVGLIKLLSRAKSDRVQEHFRRLSASEMMRDMIQNNFKSIGRGTL